MLQPFSLSVSCSVNKMYTFTIDKMHDGTSSGRLPAISRNTSELI